MSDWINDRTPRVRPSVTPSAWRVVVPVKGGPDAKSRLRAANRILREKLGDWK